MVYVLGLIIIGCIIYNVIKGFEVPVVVFSYIICFSLFLCIAFFGFIKFNDIEKENIQLKITLLNGNQQDEILEYENQIIDLDSKNKMMRFVLFFF